MTSDSRPCPRCHGSGKCHDCGGSGKQACLACEGKGERALSHGRALPCKTCGGTGQVDCAVACDSCGGTGHITEAMQDELREKYQPKFVDIAPSWSATTFLIIVNVMIFMVTREAGERGQSLFALMTNGPYVMLTGQYWRFITPMFLHGGFIHLGLNTVFALQFCPQLERIYGSGTFLALYLFAGTVGDVASWLGHHGYAGIGASGALMGVAAAYLGLHLRFRMFDDAQMRTLTIYLVVFLGLGFATGASLGGARLDNWAHLGGALGGLLFALVAPRPTSRA